MNAGRAGRQRERTGRKSGTPVGISAALKAFAQDIGIASTLAQYTIITSWPEVVGEQIARVATAQRIEKGILFVGVSSAAWRSELSMKRLEIIEKLNKQAGARIVKDIRFR